jgi:ferredoxin
MRIHVENDRCEGHAVCVTVVPHLIEIGDDELAHVMVDDVAPEHRAVAEEAALLCPKQALRLEEGSRIEE